MSEAVFRASSILQYLNIKTKSASRGAKARASFGNHYALYVLVEDYLLKGFEPSGARDGQYESYEGAKFSDLFRRQRELPFGQKLQNHSLNARLNDEFHKYFPTVEKLPIVRDVESQRYWIHEDLLNVEVNISGQFTNVVNIGRAVIAIIDAYVATKKAAFQAFLATCRKISEVAQAGGSKDPSEMTSFIRAQLAPSVDARVFEIVSFAVLKAFYGDQTVYWGWARDELVEESLLLFKTGRTNANDGGIDFVMRPLGRFFQVTETMDANKYFLDIDKIQRYPLTFVVKSTEGIDEIRTAIHARASEKYKIAAVVTNYMDAIEEIINVPILLERFDQVISAGKASRVMDEIVMQSSVEFNHEVAGEGDPDEDTGDDSV